MTPEEKIYSVLDHIEKERKISPNPNLIGFKFNDHVVGAGIVTGDDERKILLKLEKENVLKLHFSAINSEIYRILEPDINKRKNIQVEVLHNFETEYKKYKKLSKKEKNYWKIYNPLWWVFCCLSYLFELFKKYKIKSVITTTFFAFLAYDYSTAWKNVKFVIKEISRLLNR